MQFTDTADELITVVIGNTDSYWFNDSHEGERIINLVTRLRPVLYYNVQYVRAQILNSEWSKRHETRK